MPDSLRPRTHGAAVGWGSSPAAVGPPDGPSTSPGVHDHDCCPG
ncbi:hypothetical protein FM125_02820 [Micrococcus lylae]|uniref:Uncharacterized protein n=1 Tax=Micrococcus lylae TaxID=1273 RepID=A0A1R4IJN3_9MICC|nr:hypothetical protein FM125_02820 [Micrococcus lylae]